MNEEDYIASLTDPEEGIVPIEIDIDQIGNDSKVYACSMVDNLSKFYYDDEFMKSHPVFKKRVEADIDSLCLLIKMRSVDEVTQDSLIKAIAANSGNASLYRALTDIQRTILNIQTKMEETIKALEVFMKGYQMEIDFENHPDSGSNLDSDDDGDDGGAVTSRGTKDFIQKMRETI